MERTLTLAKTGTSQWNEGWHTLTISKAEYGEWTGTKFIDVWFNDYPENFNMRIYAKVGKTGEEFAIGNLFRYANAGITDALESATGETVIKMNDDAEQLTGKTVNVYFYKDGKYTKPLSQVAPIPFKNIADEFTEKDVVYFKGRAESFYSKWIEPKLADEPHEKEEATSDMPF